ncbi:MAG: response regulator [Pirellulales bacterium]|nr:response regulator [Pirellulales bacterium]
MDGLLHNLTGLLDAVAAIGTESGHPGLLGEILHAFEPALVLVADAKGSLIASEMLDDQLGHHLAEPLAAELAGCLAAEDTCRLELTSDAGPHLALAARMPGGLWGEFLACVLPRNEVYRRRLEETRTELVVCSAFAWAALHNRTDDGRLQRRIQHLLAERETLKASHAEVIAAILEEREERRRQQQEKAALQELVEAAEAASRAKSAFLANASHELRTPMTAILGYSDLLADPGISEGLRDAHVQTIRRNGHILLELIDNILDLSKIEADKMPVRRSECPLFQIVEELVSLLRVRATEADLSLDIDYVFPLPETIRTDPVRLRQVMMNLIGNAIKFTDRGGVRVRVRCRRPDGEPARVEIAVADTGIGMDDATIAHLFEPFTQADTSSTRNFGGTGLGLAISKRLAGMLGGDIAVESEPGKGSTFTLSIDAGSLDGVAMLDAPPRTILQATESATSDRRRALRGRVLLAEDGKDNQRLISAILTKAGLEVSVAENGRVAYETAAAAAAEGNLFDLIVMDMQMPEMDGYDATRRLRQDGWRGPIVALTAHAMAGDREKCLEAGCDDYLTKPIERNAFLDAVQRYLAAALAAGSDSQRP